MPLPAAEGHAVTTVEGLEADHVGKVVRESFLRQQAAQCGYCINGILMSATALLRRTFEPSEAQMRDMLQRHLCRCGVHQRIVRAVQLAAARLRSGAPK
jgi:nicotinate dehydrogenase subunit A